MVPSTGAKFLLFSDMLGLSDLVGRLVRLREQPLELLEVALLFGAQLDPDLGDGLSALHRRQIWTLSNVAASRLSRISGMEPERPPHLLNVAGDAGQVSHAAIVSLACCLSSACVVSGSGGTAGHIARSRSGERPTTFLGPPPLEIMNLLVAGFLWWKLSFVGSHFLPQS